MNATDAKSNQTTNQDQSGLQFAVQNIYVKDVSFESPKAPQVFGMEWKPKLDFDLQTNFANVGEDLFEVIVHLSVSVKVNPKDSKDKAQQAGEEFVAFIVDIKQAGVFVAKNFPEDQLRHVLATTAPSILYPYGRELVSSMVSRGGFPQLLLPPMNFEALYQKHLEQQGSEGSGGKATEATTTH